MSNRYTEAVRPIAERLAIQEAGLGIAVAPATQQDLVAGALASLWPAAARAMLGRRQ